MIFSISSIRRAKSGKEVVDMLQRYRNILNTGYIERVNVFTDCKAPQYILLHNPPQFEKYQHIELEKAVKWIEDNEKERSDDLMSKLREVICINLELLTSSVKAIVKEHTDLLPKEINLLAKNLGCVVQEEAKRKPPTKTSKVNQLKVVNDNIQQLQIDPKLGKLLEELRSVVCKGKPMIEPIPETKTKPVVPQKKTVKTKPVAPPEKTDKEKEDDLKKHTATVKTNMSFLTNEDIEYFNKLLNCKLQLPEAKNQKKSEDLDDALFYIKAVFYFVKKESELNMVKSLCSK